MKLILKIATWFWARWQCLGEFLAPSWLRVKVIWSVFWITRFSALAVLAGGILIAGTAQGQDITAGIHDKGISGFFLLNLAVLWLALQAWYWARLQIYRVQNLNAPGENGDSVRVALVEGWRNIVPRFYAFLTYFTAAWALWFSGHIKSSVFVSAIGIGVIWALIRRRPLASRLAADREWFARVAIKPAETPITKTVPLLGLVTLISSIVLAFAALIGIIINPLGIGAWAGPSPIAFFAFGCLIPFGSILTIIAEKTRIPVVGGIILLAVFFSLFNDNHDIELVNEANFKPTDKLNFSQAMSQWIRSNSPSEKSIPVVFVSTAGGGLRAAYWTATVLGSLQDHCEQFYQRTFSISGVSGGSVGTSIFAVRMAQKYKNFPPVRNLDGCTPSVQPVSPVLQSALSADFLGPTIASMLFPDLMQRFWPFPWFESRGVVLKKSWEAGWNHACNSELDCSTREGSLSLGSAFGAFGPKENEAGWKPVLLLNSTHQETGKRIITSHIQATRDVFFDAFDFHNLLASEITLASAALNSARFTFVSPPGLIKDRFGNIRGHSLDGGYFENNGAVTSSEVLLKFLEGLPKHGVKIRPIIIQITSDPDLNDNDYATTTNASGFLETEVKYHRFMNELAGPVRGILKTRSARGVLAGKTLAELVQFLKEEGRAKHQHRRFPLVEKPVFANFEMCLDEKSKNKPPLGWVMSNTARESISGLLTSSRGKGCDNQKSFQKVIKALTNSSNQAN